MNPNKYYEFNYNGEQYIVPREWIEEHNEWIRKKAIDEVRKICGTENPSYTKCAYCLFATFKDNFDTTICKIEQLKEQNK